MTTRKSSCNCGKLSVTYDGPTGTVICAPGRATYHFCPECGSTVYWDISIAPDVLGVAVGGFTDPTFPPPMISGFEAYGPAWAMNASALPMPHHEYDGTSHGGPRA